MKRDIIKINQKKSTGCGDCIPGCPEGALQVIDGKAHLISDLFCDGLGAYIGTCPQGAIEVETREADPYDEYRVMENVAKGGPNVIKAHLKHLDDHESANLAHNGAILQMFNHGLSAAGMFFLVGVIYERTHTRNLKEFGGLFPLMPVYGGILIFTSMASLGLPGMGGFISEFLVVRGSWPIFTLITVLGMIGLFFTGAYILKGIKMVLHGPLNENWVGHLKEINAREIFVIVPLMVLSLVIGIWPA